jgi:CRP-like cAMP-binding protein
VVIQTAQQYPILYKHLALITCARIRRAFDWIDDATSLNTSARLASMLMGLIGTYGKQVNGDIKIDLRLSQEELGFMLGTTRQTINKIIQSWQKQEFIDMHYGFITIKNQSELRAMMNPE